jgi:ribonuclease HI
MTRLAKKGIYIMAKRKFYAVQVGKVPGVYETWDECKVNVEGVPGAKYKSFYSEAEAWEFVDGIEPNDEGVYDSERDGIVAYVDGSYDNDTGNYAYGVVILNGERETHLSGYGDDPGLGSMRNVAGEILGAISAMQYALDNGIREITIVHDYAGLADWPLRNWKANKKSTAAYVAFYDQASESVDIKFKKAKSHSGNFYNDVADGLAKIELGMQVKSNVREHIKSFDED